MLPALALLLPLLLGAPAPRQPLPCTERLGAAALLERLEERASQEIGGQLEQLKRADVLRKESPNPRAAKSAGATSLASSTAASVDSPALTELLALALDQGLAQKGDAHALTLSLNGQTLAQILDPGIVDSTEAYRTLSGLRRLGGKVTLGGKGDSFDRDGDGEVDEGLEAKTLDESVAWEIQYRLIGTRDRRDSATAARMIASFAKSHELDTIATNKALGALLAFERANRPDPKDAPAAGEFCAADWDDAFEDGAVSSAFAELVASAQQLRSDYEAAVQREDHALLLTVFSAGVDRQPELGPNKLSFGGRAVWGSPRLDHTFNVSWTQTDGAAGQPKPTALKLSYEASGLLAQVVANHQARCSLFASWERNQDVPDAKHRTVAQAGAKLEFTLANGVKLPLSVKWVNHRDLLQGADQVVGNFGISIDLSELKKKASDAS